MKSQTQKAVIDLKVNYAFQEKVEIKILQEEIKGNYLMINLSLADLKIN